MKKQVIRLNENDLHRMIKESVMSLLKEYEDDGNIITHDDEYDTDYEELTKDKDYKRKMSDTRARNRWKNAGSPKHVSRNYFRDYNDK